MAPTASPTDNATGSRIGPHPSYIESAKPYVFQSSIQRCLANAAMSDAKEDAVRLQGVAYIDQVRRALQLPVRTFDTAVVYYHKFRLLHAEAEYGWETAAAAALFTACKIEDTLKKSREVLAAYWNSRVGAAEQLSSDDPRFENHSKLILGLERLMLESAGFDFRSRYPQKLMVKLARVLRFDPNNEAKTMWNLSIDMYRTFAPLKQTTPTMAIACVELTARLHEMELTEIVDAGVCQYGKWDTSRAEVMETLLDLLDLYTHHRVSTAVGPLYSLETFINIRIILNKEASDEHIPRYTTYASEVGSKPPAINGTKSRNGFDPTSPLTPITPGTPGTISPGTSQPPKSAIGIRGQSGTVRFMLDAKRALDEKKEVDKYWVDEEEEYEVEVPIDERPSERERRDRERERESDRDRDRDRDRERDWDSRRCSITSHRRTQSMYATEDDGELHIRGIATRGRGAAHSRNQERGQEHAAGRGRRIARETERQDKPDGRKIGRDDVEARAKGVDRRKGEARRGSNKQGHTGGKGHEPARDEQERTSGKQERGWGKARGGKRKNRHRWEPPSSPLPPSRKWGPKE